MFWSYLLTRWVTDKISKDFKSWNGAAKISTSQQCYILFPAFFWLDNFASKRVNSALVFRESLSSPVDKVMDDSVVVALNSVVQISISFLDCWVPKVKPERRILQTSKVLLSNTASDSDPDPNLID